MLDLDRYLARVGLDGRDLTLPALQRAQVTAIPYENLDVQLGREVRLDTASLAAKLVDGGRGGYCFELNSLFAAALEAIGYPVTRLLGRVRLSDPGAIRPETHLVLLVDGLIIDVGFGAATPIGPVPLGGDASYGPWTWSTAPIRTPEGDDAWGMWFADLLLYTFSDVPRHPVDLVTPNHFTSTHPMSIFRQHLMAHRWEPDLSQLGLIDHDLTLRRAGQPDDVATIGPDDLGTVLRGRFGIELADADVDAIRATSRRGSTDRG